MGEKPSIFLLTVFENFPLGSGNQKQIQIDNDNVFLIDSPLCFFDLRSKFSLRIRITEYIKNKFKNDIFFIDSSILRSKIN